MVCSPVTVVPVRTRRALLAGVAAGLSAAAGCTTPFGRTTAGNRTGDGAGGGARALPDHPALRDVRAQPIRGPPPGEAPAVAVAFQNVRCDLCVGFNEKSYPDLRSKLIEPGKLSFVLRPIGPALASQALEATFDRSEAAFWGLRRHLYRNFLDVEDRGALAVVRTYLREQTSLDAEAVYEDVIEGLYHEAYQADVRAATDAGVEGKLAVVLFRDGEYRTTVTLPHRYEVFATALGFE